MTYRLCSQCGTKVLYGSVIYRVERIVGSEVEAVTVCGSCFVALKATVK